MTIDTILWSCYATDLTARQAADRFAATHWPKRRKTIGHELVEGNRLAIDFQVENGSRHYRCSWDEHFGFAVQVLGDTS